MPNVMGVLRAEIRRLARKETRDEIRALRKMLTAMRRRLAEARKRMDSFERTAKQAIAKRAAGAVAAAGARAESGRQVRFSPTWLRTHRKRLGLSRKAYGRLVGVSAQSILSWETGRARPRRRVLQLWRDMREKGVRELRGLLEGAGGRGGKRKVRVARRKVRKARRAVRKAVRGARRTRRVTRRARRVVRRAARKTVRARGRVRRRAARAKKK